MKYSPIEDKWQAFYDEFSPTWMHASVRLAWDGDYVACTTTQVLNNPDGKPEQWYTGHKVWGSDLHGLTDDEIEGYVDVVMVSQLFEHEHHYNQQTGEGWTDYLKDPT
jgi:hypothetical protein